MLSDEVINKVVDRVVRRIEESNTYVLKKMGESVGRLRTLTPTQAQQLAQIMRYGGDYDKITRELAKMSKLNIKDIYKIFEEVAKNDYTFAKQFYKYRNKKYIPYEQNKQLQDQVNAIAKVTADKYINITKTNGFVTTINGKKVYSTLAKTYEKLLDKAVLSVTQGKTTFNEEMYKAIKELASSGLKTIDYESGRSYRLDSAVRMCMQDGLRQLHNETQEIIGEQFDADGVEISVHMNPAPDHQYVQGKQFSKTEFKKLQEDGLATTYDKKEIDLHKELKNGETAIGFRAISEYNCYHYIFSIVLGVSEPEYSNKELKEIIDKNEKGFDYEGKHYSMYEGEQLQRQLELEIRKQKDTQIMAKASYNSAKPNEQAEIKQLIEESQQKITILTNKYRELSKKSGLLTKMDRMRVPNYKRVNVKKL